MSFRCYEYWPNGDKTYKLKARTCDGCGKHIYSNGWWFPSGNKDFCEDCSFLMGLISSQRYLNECTESYRIPGLQVAIHNGQIYQWVGEVPPWERPVKDRRNTSNYAQWRSLVFQRDGFSCQACGAHGLKLQAHHIKPYAKHADVRLDVSNGVTYCLPCHKASHKRAAL